jgi:hypothetical protein
VRTSLVVAAGYGVLIWVAANYSLLPWSSLLELGRECKVEHSFSSIACMDQMGLLEPTLEVWDQKWTRVQV